MLHSHEEIERDVVLIQPLRALPLEVAGKIGPGALEQGPEPDRRLSADPARLAERDADGVDQYKGFALLGPKLCKGGKDIGLIAARPLHRRYGRPARIFAVIIAA
jgi:hypothetical protein